MGTEYINNSQSEAVRKNPATNELKEHLAVGDNTLTINSESSLVIEDGATIEGLSYESLEDKPVLGTASGQDVESFATAEQGSKADSALQDYVIIDEDDMSSNSDTRVPTQQSVKAYVDAHAGGGGSTPDFTGRRIIYASKGAAATDERSGLSQYDQFRPFATLLAAKDAAVSGDLIVVEPGVYTDSRLGKDGVNWWFHQGAIVNSGAPIWERPGIVDPGSCTFKVFGHGVFNCTSSITACCSFVFAAASTNTDILDVEIHGTINANGPCFLVNMGTGSNGNSAKVKIVGNLTSAHVGSACVTVMGASGTPALCDVEIVGNITGTAGTGTSATVLLTVQGPNNKVKIVGNVTGLHATRNVIHQNISPQFTHIGNASTTGTGFALQSNGNLTLNGGTYTSASTNATLNIGVGGTTSSFYLNKVKVVNTSTGGGIRVIDTVNGIPIINLYDVVIKTSSGESITVGDIRQSTPQLKVYNVFANNAVNPWFTQLINTVKVDANVE